LIRLAETHQTVTPCGNASNYENYVVFSALLKVIASLQHLPMRSCFIFCLFGFLVLNQTVRADEETCAACEHPVTIEGEFEHHQTADDLQVEGVPSGDMAGFRDEVVGANFTITVSRLPVGEYTVIIGEAETYFQQSGQRLFNVMSGNIILASHLDIFDAAGGANKAYSITGHVNHTNGGSLPITFTAIENNAKFNTLTILNSSGQAVVSLNASDLADPMSAAANKPPVVNGAEIWKDPTQPQDARVKDLISRMSLAEKVEELGSSTKSIPRLGIPAYDVWSEALHGVARNGIATVFPQAIGMAATWDTPLIHSEGDVISTEARAKYNDYVSQHDGSSGRFEGLTFWSPNINIFRDPRWGRGQETYGEDPFLTGSLGVAFIQGVQGDDPNYIKAMACAKHFAVHSGPEPLRHGFNATPPERDLYETYLPQFEMAVRDGHVGGFMGAYSALDGVPDCANSFLLTDLLRNQWGFDGYIVSDCDAIHDIYFGHHYTDSLPAAAAAAVKAGCDICCGGSYNALLTAVEQNLITEPEINSALYYALKPRFQLGLFDPAADIPWSKLGTDQNDTFDHEALALKVAEESIVLLKNNGILPLDRNNIRRIAVIGANAESTSMLIGNYAGTPARPVSILDGIKAAAGPNVDVIYVPGCPLALKKDNTDMPTFETFKPALAAAQAADVVIYVGGINSELEGEESSKANSYVGFEGGDRTQIELPSVQTALLQQLSDTGKPVIFVNCSGSAMAMPWEAQNLPAIVQAWYPGEQGGKAVGEVLFGDVNPAGRLPVTFYASTADLPSFDDYSMKDRTYRYFNGTPLYAFGHGLSYTKFGYKDAKLNQKSFTSSDTVKVSFELKNTGNLDGDEVVQVYFRHVKSAVPQPKLALCSFVRLHLESNQMIHATLDIPTERFRYWDTTKKQYVVEPGKYQLLIGAASDDIRLKVPFQVTAN
jgi:beta-glucosidase